MFELRLFEVRMSWFAGSAQERSFNQRNPGKRSVPGAFVRDRQAWVLAVILSGAMTCAFASGQSTGAKPQVQTNEFLAAVDIVVAADGLVDKVVPSAALPEPVRELLVKRISQWRYQPAIWHGKPVDVSQHVELRLQAVPTTSGGFALRVLRREGALSIFASMPPAPEYPKISQREAVGGQFVYAVSVAADGNPTNIQLVVSKADNKYKAALDQAAQASMRTWRWRPVFVDGAPVVCTMVQTMKFSIADSDAPAEIDLEPIKKGINDLCPTPKLETKIESTIL